MSWAAISSDMRRRVPFPVELRLEPDRILSLADPRGRPVRSIARAAALIVSGSAVYGAAFGLWRSGLLAVYVAIKLPLLLLLTTSLVIVLNWMLAQVAGSGLSFAQVTLLACRAMAITCVVLLSLVPIATFLAVACPPASPQDDLPHNLLLLAHVVLIGCAGVYGNSVMLDGLRQLCRPQTPVRWLYVWWLATNLFVGGQLAWILRPFLGSPNYPVVFLRSNALEGNFYEFVVMTLIWRRLWGGG